MEDPCSNCLNLDKRDSFLRDNPHFFNYISGSPENIFFTQSIGNPATDQILALFESSSDCILIWDKDYNYLYANQAAIDHVKTTRDKVIGKNIRDGLGHIPDFMRLWMSRIDQVFATGQPLQVEDAMPVGDRLVYSQSVISPIRNSNGQMIAVGVIYRDITEQKTLEKELLENEKKYRQLYEQAQIPLYRTNIKDGKLIECNSALAVLLGYPSKQDCLDKCNATAHYADPKVRIKLLELLKEGPIKRFETEIIRCDGSRAWVEITAQLYAEKDYIEGAIYDITVSKILTKTELQILLYILEGKSNKEIAKIIGRSIRTIEDHRSHIMQKMNVRTLVELVQKCQFLSLSLKKINS
ncbi:MAG: PAS domain S-box protein [Phycisphaerae bacterium]|nr:PAS domain S-box protein [Phycisphaerae bacterium]